MSRRDTDGILVEIADLLIAQNAVLGEIRDRLPEKREFTMQPPVVNVASDGSIPLQEPVTPETPPKRRPGRPRKHPEA